MGRKWKLRDTQWDALDQLRFGTTDAEVFRNATLILMTAVGRSKNSIAEDFGCSPGTVDNVRKRYRDRGSGGLEAPQTARPETPSDGRVPGHACARRSKRHRRHSASVSAFGRPHGWQRTWSGRPASASDGRSRAADPARGGFFLPAAKAHDERQAGRGRLPENRNGS